MLAALAPEPAGAEQEEWLQAAQRVVLITPRRDALEQRQAEAGGLGLRRQEPRAVDPGKCRCRPSTLIPRYCGVRVALALSFH